MPTRVSGTLRVLTALGLLTASAAVGFEHRSPWLIPLWGVSFTALYAQGRSRAWHATWKKFGARGLLSAAAVAYPIQTFLVAVLYFTGYGLSALGGASDGPAAFAYADVGYVLATSLVVFLVGVGIGRLEGKMDPQEALEFRGIYARDKNTTPETGTSNEEPELALEAEPPTFESFWSGRHFSIHDYSGTALTRITEHDGSRPRRVPIGASDALIAETEQRLDIRIPETLRRLLRIRNGGQLPTYYVPLKANPEPVYDDWTGAFANDYNDIRPLEQWVSLAANYEEYRNDDEPPATEWLPGCDRMVILTHRYDDTTLLDYREGSEPTVVLADLGNEPETRVRAVFDSFKTFFAALRAEREDEPDSSAPSGFLSSQGLDLNRPDAFWGWHAGAAQKRATADELETNAFSFPQALRALYQAADGGHVAFAFCPRPEDVEFSPIPGKRLLPHGQCVSLAELSDRLEFPADARSWRELWPEPERLLVLSACFDSALLLDFRGAEGPAVLWIEDLGAPAGTHLRWTSFDVFIEELRQPARSYWGGASPLGDPTLSSLRSRPDTFFESSVPGADAAVLEASKTQLRLELPTALREAYARHDGGRVVFNYLPPQIINPHGYRNFAPQESEWERVFNGPLPPLAQLQTLKMLFEANGGGSAMEKMHEILVLEGTPGERMVVLDYRDSFRTKGGDGSALVVFEGNREHRRYERAALVFASLRAKRDALL
ncbi:MAG: SMI1/KNR4 family protein [Myxococcota bacterium]